VDRDGIAMHFQEVEVAALSRSTHAGPEEVEPLIAAQLRPRRCSLLASREAARSLLLPRPPPGIAHPALRHAMRSAGLLQWPASIPTSRSWRDVARGDDGTSHALLCWDCFVRFAAGDQVVAVDTRAPSPFASSLLFSYVAEFMYAGDAPLASAGSRAHPRRERLAELLAAKTFASCDPEAIAAVELELQGLLQSVSPRDPDEGHDLLVVSVTSPRRRRSPGHLRGLLRALERERRACGAPGRRIARIAAEDAGRYREALGASLPVGLPEIFLSPGPDPLDSLLRAGRESRPLLTADPASRWALPSPAIERR